MNVLNRVSVGLAVALGLAGPAVAAPIQIVVRQAIIAPAPPPPRVHVSVVRPAPRTVWMEGYWARDLRGRRIWVSGYVAEVPARRVVTHVHTPVGTARHVKMH